ncbi:MAG: halocyanin domain-containing protein [Halorientalis sp.]
MTPPPTATPIANPKEKIDNWLKNVEIYDGTITDKTADPRVTIIVGADGKNGLDGFSFDPPAVRVKTGTAVSWVWEGQGGKHNVVDTKGRFDSGPPEAGGGTTFRHTFEDPGLYLYKCGTCLPPDRFR